MFVKFALWISRLYHDMQDAKGDRIAVRPEWAWREDPEYKGWR